MRWLDLFAGTGSVGIEALSRGCDECHFIEMDPWVVRACLGPNLEACDVVGRSVVHTTVSFDISSCLWTLVNNSVVWKKVWSSV